MNHGLADQRDRNPLATQLLMPDPARGTGLNIDLGIGNFLGREERAHLPAISTPAGGEQRHLWWLVVRLGTAPGQAQLVLVRRDGTTSAVLTLRSRQP